MTVSKTLFEFVRWAFLVSYLYFLYFVYTLPPYYFPPLLLKVNDKLLHYLDFFLLTLLTFRTFFLSSRALFSSRAIEKSVGLSLFYAVFLEWCQKTVPGREMSLSDLIADGFGIFCAVLVFRFSKLTHP